MPSLDDWTDRLAVIVADSLLTLAPELTGEAVSMIALDCHPWNGGLYLAILKRTEIDADPEMSDPTEMASWALYDCGGRTDAWGDAAELAKAMRRQYSTSAEPAAVAENFLVACASALTGPAVQGALEFLHLDPGFRLSVTHPDNGQEFCA